MRNGRDVALIYKARGLIRKHSLLERLSLYPEKLPKTDSFCTIFGTFSTGFEMYKKSSSATHSQAHLEV